MFRTNIVFLSIILLLISTTVIASSNEIDVIPEDMMDIYSLAQQGDPEAQEDIGEMYHYGRGVTRNFEKAFFWYELAANQGHAPSQDYLGLFYAGGLGVKQDCGKAITWFENAYFNGFTQSKANLSWLLATCEDVAKRDGKKALMIAVEDIEENGVTIGRMDNLAAALAETGDFEKAAELQLLLVKELEKTDEVDRLSDFRKRLELYKINKPWRGASYETPEDYK